MTDPAKAIEEFLRGADSVYEEYEAGYIDADAALRQLEGHIEELRDSR